MAAFVLRWPDPEAAESMDQEYGSQDLYKQLGIKPDYIDRYYEKWNCRGVADRMVVWLCSICFVHFFSCISCIQREMFDTMLGNKGRIMRLLEVFCTKGYLFTTLFALDSSSIFQYFKSLEKKFPAKKEYIRACFIEKEKL
jgi:hypothetical protein